MSSPVHWDSEMIETSAQLLGTTRAIRRRLQAEGRVDPAVLRRCLELAGQAPSAGDRQPLRWVVVTDPQVRARVGAAYLGAFQDFDRQRGPAPDDATARLRVGSLRLAELMASMPVQVIACTSEPAPEKATGPVAARFWASVLPAAWSLQLALRSHGLGSCLTTVWLHREAEIRGLLGIPDDWTPAVLLPVAPIGGENLSPAARRPVDEITRWI